MTQLAIEARDNKNLFSNYYLDNQIKNNPEWKKEEHKAAFSEIKKLYDTEKDFIPTLNEKQLEQRFFALIFKILNHTIEVNEGTEQGEFPDYAFFPDIASRNDAKKMGNSLYNNAIAIGEVKRWGIELDRFGKDEKDRKRNPSLQIWIYLHDVTPKWGILSNGAKWRLYCKDRRRDDYYEIDLPSLLAKDESKNVEEFKYFYYFFRKDAFLPSKEGRTFLDDVLKGSADYAKDIGDDLKDNVYKAMKKVAEGFFSWSQNGLDIHSDEARETVQKCTMLLLYRFLFLLYAEGKGLLNLGAGRYRDSYSFYKLKNEVKDKQDGPTEQRYMSAGTSLWFRLRDVFRLINQGNESLGIPKNEIDVPAYNGGLFDPDKNKELDKEWTISDTFIAAAIDLLSRSRADGGRLDFVDYSTLEIRHLGSIYEGLLEYKLRVAEDEMVVNKGEWVKLEEYNKDRKQKKVFSDFGEFDRVRKGQIYLATDKGDRKATGSYYTPDYIVNYIVKNTVGPVVDEKWKEAEANKKSFVDATLSVKVLDPAMGSGHFLVGSIEFLSEKLLLAVKKDIDNSRFSDESHLTSDWARREIVAHCIYGVDLNPMAVELAKVGLWLTTISKEKPLSFLDHRLKQGNSLIGAKLEDLSHYPDVNAKKKDKKVKDMAQQTFEVDIERPFFDKIVKILNNLTDINDDTIENIHKKQDIFEKLINSQEYQRIRAFANLHTSIYFGVETTKMDRQPKDGYNDILWALRENEEGWRKKTNREWFGKARKLAQEKSFFHWELEFPEIFFESGAPKENPGWDAVVGNPPYVSSVGFLDIDREYFMNRYETAIKRFDIYNLFCEIGLNLLHDKGINSFILPYPVLNQNYSENLREILLKKSKIHQIVNLSNIKVFEDAIVRNCIIVLEKNADEKQCLNNSITIYETHNNSNNLIIPTASVSQTLFLSLPKKMFRVDVSPKLLNLFEKINKISIKSVDLCYISRGAVIHSEIENKKKEEYIGKIKINENFKPYIEGEDVGRYSIMYRNLFLEYKPSVQYRPAFPELFENEKLLIYKVTGDKGLIIAYDNLNFYNNESLYNCILKYLLVNSKKTGSHGHSINEDEIETSKKYNIKYILSLFNSTLLNIIYQKLYGYGLNVYPDDIKNLPIRRISFTTPPDRRAALVEQAKALYPAEAPDSQKILDFVGARLSAAPEESDVVHDLLAHLAEQMIEMNKEKNAEIKGFLRWLEGEIGAPVEELTNKTALKEYYDYKYDFETFVKVLSKNNKKLKEGYDPTRREPKDKLEKEYNASLNKLTPLLKRIEVTDGLIDQIVYKLYGLTPEEIAIVEISNKGK